MKQVVEKVPQRVKFSIRNEPQGGQNAGYNRGYEITTGARALPHKQSAERE